MRAKFKIAWACMSVYGRVTIGLNNTINMLYIQNIVRYTRDTTGLRGIAEKPVEQPPPKGKVARSNRAGRAIKLMICIYFY